MDAKKQDRVAIKVSECVIGAGVGAAIYVVVFLATWIWVWWGLALGAGVGLVAALIFGQRAIDVAKSVVRHLWWWT